MNRLLYAGGITLCEIVVIGLSVASTLPAVIGSFELSLALLVVTLVALVVGIVLLFRLVYGIWSRIQDEEASISPGLATGLLAIPIFNLVWLFVVFPGYAKRYNSYVERHKLQSAPRLSVFLQVLSVIFFILPLPFLQWLVTYVAVGRLVEAANALDSVGVGGDKVRLVKRRGVEFAA